MRNSVRSLSYLFILGIMLATFSFAKQPNYVVRYFDRSEINVAPGEIVLSPEYQTTIEFENLSIESASSGRTDQVTVEIDKQVIRLRANQEVVNTDLTVRVGGQTLLFILKADPTLREPRRYLVFDK
ncbi:MAG: hypothetical protein ACRCYY_08015 [Trueperaceae bacterium]